MTPENGSGKHIARGLPLFRASDPEAVARERAELAALEGRGTLSRWRGYFSKTGPGWLQSALTLGGGSAVAVEPGVRFAYVNTGLPGGETLGMRYLVAQIAVALAF